MVLEERWEEIKSKTSNNYNVQNGYKRSKTNIFIQMIKTLRAPWFWWWLLLNGGIKDEEHGNWEQNWKVIK